MRIPATVVLLLALSGCGLLGKKSEDAGAPAADMAGTIDAAAAVAAPGAPVGKNAASVARFATEVAMNEPKVIGQTATPRTSPQGATIVATLKTGTAVTRIATNAGNSLIVFPDPNVPTDNLMGWVTEAAFSAAAVVVHHADAGTDAGAVTATAVDAGAPAVVDAGPPPITCKPGYQRVQLSAGAAAVCRRACSADKDCKSSKSCQTANADHPATGQPSTVKVCPNDAQ
jgi:hypothetical protein